MTRLFTFLVLLVLTGLPGNTALAQRTQRKAVMKLTLTETIDFTGYGGSGFNGYDRKDFSDEGYPIIDGEVISDRIIFQTPSDWNLYGSSTYNETYFQKNQNNSQSSATLTGLQAGDVVTIWGEVGNTEEGAFKINGNVDLLNTTYYTDNNGTYPDSKEYKITDSGDVEVLCSGDWSGIRKITIQSLVRETPHFDYDPGFEDYDMYDEFSENDPHKYAGQWVNGNYQIVEYNPHQYSTSYTLSDEATGITYGENTAAKYIILHDSKITANNRIAVDPTAGDWRFNFGLRAPDNGNGKWANFSICNLREGDRVVFSYTGTAPVFSSVAGGTSAPDGPYNGSNAFFDQLNDGQFDEGEDTYITSGAQPLTDWHRGEGNFYIEDYGESGGDYQLIYTRYVITEDGHLDLAIAPDTRIVHIKIYSDHQAMMVDEYDENWYTARFDITGELQANEHIVPGGLEVHVGSSDASQHAHVVSSAHGPVAIVNAVDGFKLPGMSRGEDGELDFEFDLANKIPETGTFYKFMPLEDGKMKLTFQAASMNYYTYGLDGDATYVGDLGSWGDEGWDLEWDRPNEQTADVNCPYYLVRIDERGNKTVTTYSILNGDEKTTDEIDVHEGDTYYLYGGWNASGLYYNGSGEGKNNLEYFPFGDPHPEGEAPYGKNACGVAKLLEVNFNPVKKIYPLAKWVPNGTEAVKTDCGVPNPDQLSYAAEDLEYELADLWGYNDLTSVTVKKMSGNITDCHPFLQEAGDGEPNHYKLMIDQITFAENTDKGGTILIKIGDARVKSNPVYTLTIAYSGDPQFDGDAGRGHIWDYSSNTLQGLEYNPILESPERPNRPGQPGSPAVYSKNVATPVTYGQYFDDYFAADVSSYSSKDEVLEALPKSGSGLLYDEIEGGNSDWMFNYRLQNAGKLYDPLFSNKYDLEGDNADLIWNTEGMVMKTSANVSVMFNEFKGDDVHESTKDPDRYVGILEGGEFRIPWLMPNDRVVIYMGVGKGAFNDQVVFSITNAYDALHNEINPDDEYIIGGSKWNYYTTTKEAEEASEGEEQAEPEVIVNDDPYYRGCYHFFATGDTKNEGNLPADMIFKMTGGTLCKIYSIQVYRGDRIITNEVVGNTEDDKFLLVSTAADPNDGAEATKGDASYWTLKYFGKEQKLADETNDVNNDIVAQTGNITKELVTVTDEESDTYNTFTYPYDSGEIGTIRVRGKDMEKNMKYVADYADHNVTIAYQETMTYPYTWDFTDVDFYSGRDLASEDNAEPTKPEWFDEETWSTSYEKSSEDLSLWEGTDGGYLLRLNSQENSEEEPQEMDNIFETAKNEGGNQIWANGAVVPETQGLYFYTDNNVADGADQISISADGMTCPYLVIPNVPSKAAVYLRMKKTTGTAVKYMFGKQESWSEIGSSSATEKFYQVNDPTNENDYIVAILNNSTAKANLTLSLNGFELKKLGVSSESKKLTVKGWATESREIDIDTDLTWYLTGKNIETIFIEGIDDVASVAEGQSTLSLTRATRPLGGQEDGYVVSALEEGQAGAYLLHNLDDAANVDILGGGFHLFVPDMYDKVDKNRAEGAYSMLKAHLSTEKYEVGGVEGTNYVLSSKAYNSKGEIIENAPVAFYRVRAGGASSQGHGGYLQIASGSAGSNPSAFGLVFDDGEVVTGISELTNSQSNEGAYTINGLKMDKMPTEKGIYIVNGKKVVIK